MKRFFFASATTALVAVASLFLAFGPGGGIAKAAIIFNAHVHDDYFHPTGTFVPGPGHVTAQALCMQANPDSTCTAKIKVGDSVNWVAPAPLAVNAHTVTECTDPTFTVCGAGTSSPNPIEDSGVRFQPGWPYVVAFNTAGTYYYRCEVHPTVMRGTVMVQSTPSGVGGVVDVFTGGGDDSSDTPYLLIGAIVALALAGIGGYSLKRRMSDPTP